MPAFEVHGTPKAQPRGRARRFGAHARVFMPGTADSWKARVCEAGRAHRPREPFEGPLHLSIDFLLPRPKSRSRKKDHDGEVWAPVRPDRDNLDKAVLDALKDDGWYRDDSQVVSGSIRKLYHAKGGVAGARIEIIELADQVEQEEGSRAPLFDALASP